MSATKYRTPVIHLFLCHLKSTSEIVSQKKGRNLLKTLTYYLIDQSTNKIIYHIFANNLGVKIVWAGTKPVEIELFGQNRNNVQKSQFAAEK